MVREDKNALKETGITIRNIYKIPWFLALNALGIEIMNNISRSRHVCSRGFLSF
jgi:hypothetical protein